MLALLGLPGAKAPKPCLAPSDLPVLTKVSRNFQPRLRKQLRRVAGTIPKLYLMNLLKEIRMFPTSYKKRNPLKRRRWKRLVPKSPFSMKTTTDKK
jgi:hypothetical protein